MATIQTFFASPPPMPMESPAIMPLSTGNKRTALVVSILFLNRNGWDTTASKTDEYDTYFRLAEGSLSEEN